jgi:hypothetical protein
MPERINRRIVGDAAEAFDTRQGRVLPPRSVLRLQQAIGNRAVVNLLTRPPEGSPQAPVNATQPVVPTPRASWWNRLFFSWRR